MAIYRRNPTNVIHHSDQGTQYTSIAFSIRCKEAGVRPSMGSVGDCYDNAMRFLRGLLQSASSPYVRGLMSNQQLSAEPGQLQNESDAQIGPS
jgi:hypothetical protein